jgi:chorismate lyase/3-hydroxybenzoate synthase
MVFVLHLEFTTDRLTEYRVNPSDFAHNCGKISGSVRIHGWRKPDPMIDPWKGEFPGLPVRVVQAATPPSWVGRLLDGAPMSQPETYDDGGTVRTALADRFTLVEAFIPGAADQGAAVLEQASEDAYLRIARAMERTDTPHPVRFWNFVPRILETGDTGGLLYEAFNRGRFKAFKAWFGKQEFASRITAATGVGHRGKDLVVFGLAGARSGDSVENPRQVPAYRYSDDFGDLPPCFARATRLARGPLLVSGTAAVVGEESMHPEDVKAQSLETFSNMDELAGGPENYSELRVYVVRDGDAAAVLEQVRDHFSNLITVELCPADLCRRDLLVEIEGIAGRIEP